jgi:chromosomal replication initiation ATPase DnaA
MNVHRATPRNSSLKIPPSLLRSILEGVSLATGVRPHQILGPDRSYCIAWPRQAVMYALRSMTDDAGAPRYSFPEIGRALGGLDHTTVMHGVRKHAERLAVGATYQGPGTAVEQRRAMYRRYKAQKALLAA